MFRIKTTGKQYKEYVGTFVYNSNGRTAIEHHGNNSVWLGLTLHGGNIGALHKVLKLGNFILELIQRDLLILCKICQYLRFDRVWGGKPTNNDSELELLDTEADRHELGCTPDQTVFLDAADSLFQLLHVCLVVPRLDIEGDNGLGHGDRDELINMMCFFLQKVKSKNLCNSLCLSSLLLIVRCNTLCLDPLGLGIVLLRGSNRDS